jgi:hypothetical protein
LFSCLVICEIALILAGGRAGWVTYPLILFICWLFSYFSTEGRLSSYRFRFRDVVKVLLSIPITIGVSLLILFCVLMPLGDQFKKPDGSKINRGSEQTGRYLASRAKTLMTLDAASRDRTWGQGLAVGRESLAFGVGYEAFFWQAHILDKIPESHFNQFRNERERIYESPHNVLVSVFVSGGIVGLFVWLLMVGYALVIMVFDLLQNRRLMNIPVIISIISFHMYGMFQSMQYIPMIWLLIFLCLGYAMIIKDTVLPDRLRRVVDVLTKGSVLLVAIGLFVYLGNFESRSLAEKYGLKTWAMEQDRDQFAGFYQDSKRWKYGDFRWCGKRGSILIAERGARNAERQGLKAEEGGQRTEDGVRNAERGAGSAEDLLVELAFHCRTPGVAEEPVVVTVSHEGEVVDEILFDGRQSEVGSRQEKGKKRKGKKDQGFTVRRSYEVPIHPGEEGWLDIEVSRTWIPHNHLGNFDRRELGIGVKILNSIE